MPILISNNLKTPKKIAIELKKTLKNFDLTRNMIFELKTLENMKKVCD